MTAPGLPQTPTPTVAHAGTRYYRKVFWTLGGYGVGFALVVALLLLSITDANAGYPALFFGSVLLATTPLAGVACGVLAARSLLKGEPYRGAMSGVLVVCCLVVWKFGPLLVRFLVQFL